MHHEQDDSSDATDVKGVGLAQLGDDHNTSSVPDIDDVDDWTSL